MGMREPDHTAEEDRVRPVLPLMGLTRAFKTASDLLRNERGQWSLPRGSVRAGWRASAAVCKRPG